MALKTIRLYGKLGAQFGRIHRANLDTGSIAEAVRYLRANFPAIDKYLIGAKDQGVGFAVFHGQENLDGHQLHDPCGNEDIRIAPIIMGSKQGGVLQVIVGAVLIVVGALAMTYGAVIGGDVWGPYVMDAGIAMAAGGVVQLLSPHPKSVGAHDSADNTPSYAFNGPINTQAQGHPVPVLYGELWVGSAVISAGIDVKDDIKAPTAPRRGHMGGYWKFGKDAPQIPEAV